MGIIKSMMDTDLYTLTVMYFYMQKMNRAVGTFTFFDRNKMSFPKGFDKALQKEVDHMGTLTFKDDEVDFLKEKLYYLPPFFFDFIKCVKFDTSMIDIKQDEDGKLHVTAEGHLYKALLWEVPLLATISELYYKMNGYDLDNEESLSCVYKKTFEKGRVLLDNYVKFSEFGTRRRASRAVHDTVVKALADANNRVKDNIIISSVDGMIVPSNLSGTSNLELAMKYNLTPIGTMSHQLISSVGALFGYNEANFLAMKWWQEIYNADLGVFLTDTFTTDVFIRNFSKTYAKLLDGVRQDSGCPYEYTDKIVNKYKSLNINPLSKAITYSDALTVEKAISINNYAKDKINPQFGIGTHFTNDIDGINPCNIVMKLTRVKLTENTDWCDCIKLSDSKGKHTGNVETINHAKYIMRLD